MALAQLAARTVQAQMSAPVATDRTGELAALQSIGTVCRFARNQTIFSDGDPANYSFKVLSGAVRLVKLMADGRRHIAGFQLTGDLFGLEWSGEYMLTAEAVSDVTVVRYSRTVLERLSEERSDVRKQLTERLRIDLCAAHQHLIQLGCQSAKERVASFLLFLAERTDASDGESIAMPMGRQDMADYLGLTIETVCRTLSDLKEARVIAVPNRHEITVLNLEELESIASADSDG
jgi:CRP-like cAMP-binding protein